MVGTTRPAAGATAAGIPCEIIGWDRLHTLCCRLAAKVRASGFQPEAIVAIGRGGWVPGRVLSDLLGVT